jgi:hypothetical protein
MMKPAWQQSEYMRYFYKIEGEYVGQFDHYPSAFHFTIERVDDGMFVMSAWCDSATSTYVVAYMAQKFRTMQEARDAQPRWHDSMVATMKQRYDEEKAAAGAILSPQTSEHEYAHEQEVLALYQIPMWED